MLSSTTNSKHLFYNAKQILLFLILFLIFDRAISFVLSEFYGQINTGTGRYNYITENRFDGVIMGSSTSTCYYSEVLSAELDKSFINAGMDGSALIYSRSLLDLLVENNVKPELLILNIDLFEIQEGAWFGNYYSMIDKLAPLYGRSELLDNALYKGSWKEKLKYQISTYKYNGLILSLLSQSVLNSDAVYRRIKSPKSIQLSPLDEKTVATNFSGGVNLSERKVTLYEEFIRACKKNDISLFFIQSPIYYPNQSMIKRDRELQYIFESIADTYSVPFIKITQDSHPVFKSNRLFKDVLHLNNKGSLLFSKIVAAEIKKRL